MDATLCYLEKVGKRERQVPQEVYKSVVCFGGQKEKKSYINTNRIIFFFSYNKSLIILLQRKLQIHL